MILTVAGGDARAVCAAEILAQSGAEIRFFGFERAELPHGAKKTDELDGADVLLLPYPAFRSGTLFAPFAAKAESEAGFFDKCGGALVVGGGIGNGERRADFSGDETFLAENAYLTAEAALGILLGSVNEAVKGSRVTVAGYGRIGRRLAKLIGAVGGRVFVAARGRQARADAEADGFEAAGFEEIEAPLAASAAVMNTVPARVFGEREINAMRRGSVYIELASPPYGADVTAFDGKPARYIPAPGLPGKHYPVSAGRILAGCVARTLRERGFYIK